MRQNVVLRDAEAFGIHKAEVVLGIGVALLGRLLEPLHRLGVVLRDALAFVVHEA